MCELNHDLLALAVGELDDFLEGLHLAVFPEPNVFGRDAAFFRHGCGFYGRESGSSLHDAYGLSVTAF